MKIAAILHKVNPAANDFAEIENFLSKLIEASLSESDIVIGPDYALGSYLTNASLAHKAELFERLSLISQKSKSLIIPGTLSYAVFEDSEGRMVHSAPIFLNGQLQQEFLKERDNGELARAERAELLYSKGDSSKNRLSYQGKIICVGICGDHANQNVRGSDLELVLAFDRNAGFWPRPPNDRFKRKVIVCDGYEPKAEAFDYDPDKEPKLADIPIIKKNTDFSVFDVQWQKS